jgi:hypothetical protein
MTTKGKKNEVSGLRPALTPTATEEAHGQDTPYEYRSHHDHHPVAITLDEGGRTVTTVIEYRQSMVDDCKWAIKHRSEISYGQVRPIPVNLPEFSLPFTTDCSGFVTIMAKWSGNPDPNGNDFDGQGYTGTMLNYLPHIPLGNTWRGDLAVFGPYPGLHVVVLLAGGSRGSNPPVASHGGAVGPGQYLLYEVRDFFGQDCIVTCLRLRSNGG